MTLHQMELTCSDLVEARSRDMDFSGENVDRSGGEPISLDAEIGHVHQEIQGVGSTTRPNMLIMCHKVKIFQRRFKTSKLKTFFSLEKS